MALVDAALLFAIAVCGGLLIAIAGQVLFHVLCGLFFAAVAAYTLLKAETATRHDRRLAWFACTGAVGLLFCYWALQVVFRPPNIKTTVGCGGVKFVGPDGSVIEDGPGLLRTEL